MGGRGVARRKAQGNLLPVGLRQSVQAKRRGRTVLGHSREPGIFKTLESDHPHEKHGAITVVGMALNAAVAKVKVTTCSGKVEALHPKKLPGPGSELGHISDYRYIAFAVRGPWCAERIVTSNEGGAAVFETSAIAK